MTSRWQKAETNFRTATTDYAADQAKLAELAGIRGR
jgi:hypothetical protein